MKAFRYMFWVAFWVYCLLVGFLSVNLGQLVHIHYWRH